MTNTITTQNVLHYGVDGGNVILFVAAIPSGEKSKLKRECASVKYIMKQNRFEINKKF